MRAIWVETILKSKMDQQQGLVLLVSHSRSTAADVLDPAPAMLSARCEIQSSSQAESDKVVRRVLRTRQTSMVILEEMGESIARHIWYAICHKAQWVEAGGLTSR